MTKIIRVFHDGTFTKLNQPQQFLKGVTDVHLDAFASNVLPNLSASTVNNVRILRSEVNTFLIELGFKNVTDWEFILTSL